MAEPQRVGDRYTSADAGGNYLRNEALCSIADELRKLRLLKEYELGVLVGSDGDSTLQVVKAGYSSDGPAEGENSGTALFDEDQGRLG